MPITLVDFDTSSSPQFVALAQDIHWTNVLLLVLCAISFFDLIRRLLRLGDTR